MSDNGAFESVEIERKYEVSADAELPSEEDFAQLGLVVSDQDRFRLVARYYDTPTGVLAAARLAVRSRSGGADAGWHLKERSADGVRELHWPPGEEMPEGLRAELRERVGQAADDVAPVATMRTERSILRISGDGSTELVEIADDRVRAEDHASGVKRAWREWEAELLPQAPANALEIIDQVLRSAGAVESLSEAKIARTTSRLIDLALAKGASAEELGSLAVMDLADRLAAEAGEDPALSARVSQLRELAQRVRTLKL